MYYYESLILKDSCVKTKRLSDWLSGFAQPSTLESLNQCSGRHSTIFFQFPMSHSCSFDAHCDTHSRLKCKIPGMGER